LQITNHGLHEWQVTPGLPDTGGQNVYVNSLTEAFIRRGHRVTIVNRGGFPHPASGASRAGSVPHPDGPARIVYLEDGRPEFVRKEDMASQVPALTPGLVRLLTDDPADLVVSHYWDGGLLGVAALERLPEPPPHLWVPHSLGTLKMRNVEPETWDLLRLDERIAHERRVVAQADGLVATSVAIASGLEEDYERTPEHYLPPGVDVDRYHPRPTADCGETLDLLARRLDLPAGDIAQRPMVLEISRTDDTKRKDVLLRAFAAARHVVPEALLTVTIDEGNPELHDRLHALIWDLQLTDSVAVLGSVWDHLPCLYALATVYCTPSVMEGFGMSAEEAAASGAAVIASDRVPFAVEYLLGPSPMEEEAADGGMVRWGTAGVVVTADSVEGFSMALAHLLTDRRSADLMGSEAREIAVARLSWDRLAGRLLWELGRD
jgi:glycosyltransferase involved in cell wall biosynthesis